MISASLMKGLRLFYFHGTIYITMIFPRFHREFLQQKIQAKLLESLNKPTMSV